MAGRVAPRAFLPPFDGFAQFTGCDAQGANGFPLAINPANVEAVAYFNSLSGDPGEIMQIHLVSGQSLYALNTSPVAAVRGRRKGAEDPNPFMETGGVAGPVGSPTPDQMPAQGPKPGVLGGPFPEEGSDTYERPSPSHEFLSPRSENEPR